MVSASLHKHEGDKTKQKRKEGGNIAACQKKKEKLIPRQILVPANQKSAKSPSLKELAAENLIREKGARSIGSGTFGTCYLGKFRGISVVIKEFKYVVRDGTSSLSRQQSEAKHEARVLLKLVDHPGVPLLFGVQLKEMPTSIVMKFHGDGDESLTIYKAAKYSKVTEKQEWNRLLEETANALDHVHGCGFAHNDIKSNNFVLEKRQDKRLHPVIIDFGKSVAFSKAKIPNPKPAHLTEHYKRSYIAPELVDGKGKPLVESDIYSLAFLITSVYEMLKFSEIAVVKKGLSAKATNRPSISEVKAALCAAC